MSLCRTQPPVLNRQRLTFSTLALALIGYWSPWLTHRAATLQLNGFELSEWITYLPGLRDGSLRVTRMDFLIPLACLVLLVGLVAARADSVRPGAWFLPRALKSPLGWGLLFLALVCALAIFPAYPYILTAYQEPEFQFQFFLACALPFGLLLTLYLPNELNAALQILLALLGGIYGVWAFLAIRPAFSELFNAPWPIGLGWWLMLAGFAGLVIAGVRQLFAPR